MHWYVLNVIYYSEYELSVCHLCIYYAITNRYKWTGCPDCTHGLSGSGIIISLEREFKSVHILFFSSPLIRTKSVAHLFMLLPGWETFK